MNSSGIKRGLATTAVSALAIAGLPLIASSASAQPGSAFETGGADAVTLVQPWTAPNPTSVSISTANDGKDSTARLTASAGANVSAVSFYYTIGNAAPVLIGTSQRNDNGFFAVEWAAAGLGGSTVEIFAVNGGSTPAAIADLSNQQGKIADINNNDAAVEVTDGDTIGVFQAPYNIDGNAGDTDQYVAFTGTASPGFAVADLNASWLTSTNAPAAPANPGDPANIRTPNYQGGALVAGSKILTSPANQAASAPESFAGVLDINGYTFGGASDDIFIHAVNTAGATDAGEAYTLYRQTITTVTATADRTNVPNGASATVTVTVKDQNGNPVAGARVQSSNTGVTEAQGGGDAAQITNALGQATFTQTNGTAYFYADATDNGGFQDNLGDKRSADVAVTQFVAAPTTIAGDSENGVAFDLDEVDGNDITVQVQDQAGNNFPGAGRTVDYYWVITPFDGAPATQRIPATGNALVPATTDGNGEAIIPFPSVGVTDPEGTYELFASLRPDVQGNNGVASAKVLTVKAGEAAIDYDGADPLTAPAGSAVEVTGTLELADGTGLPGREVQLDYTGTNAAFVLANGATTGTVTLTTGANGGFSANLKDPTATPQPTENGTIAGTTNAVADDGGQLDDPAAVGNVAVRFFSADAPAGSTVVIGGLAGTGKPGVAQAGTATVTNGGVAVANTAVTLTVDGDSFFTNGTAASTAQGANVGDLTSLGKSITLVTDNAGVVNFQVAVERSEEFDDDGLAEDIVTATISTGSDTEDVDYSSAMPLNGGEVEVAFSADRFQESTILPQAPTTDDVYYNVTTTDSFGNEVAASVGIDLDGDGTVDTTETTDFNDENVEFSISSDTEQDITPSVTWTAPRNVFGPGNTPAAATTAPIEGDGPTAEFYVVDFAESTFTLAQQGPENVPVGTTVIMDYTAVDQNGEPIEFSVDFFRTGPDDFQDGDPNNPNPIATGEDGRATYVFSGAAEGTATVTAIGFLGGEAVAESQASDTVTFDGPVDERADIVVELDGKNNGRKADILTVTTTPAADGALATLFKVAKNGNRTPFRFKTLDNEGKVKFRAKDKNGNRKTKFVVVVDETNTTKAGESNNKNVR